MRITHSWYNSNQDYPELKDKSSIYYANGLLTLACNGEEKEHKVKGTIKLDQNELEKYTVCPDDPHDTLNLLGLELDSWIDAK